MKNKFKFLVVSLFLVVILSTILIIESSNNIFQIGVEWHPERMITGESKRLFGEFINQIKETI